jgi:hypothetical protein
LGECHNEHTRSWLDRAGPVVSFAPASLAFGNQPQGTSSSALAIALTKAGSGTLNINSEISVNGLGSGEFHIHTVKNGCPLSTFRLAPKASRCIGVEFAPATLATLGVKKSAQVLIVDDAPCSPHSIELSGKATPQQNIPKSEPCGSEALRGSTGADAFPGTLKWTCQVRVLDQAGCGELTDSAQAPGFLAITDFL